MRAFKPVRAQFNLDHIYFIPSALPPHKAKGTLATAQDRFEMVRLAIEGHPRLKVKDVELQRPGLSYTIDTLRYFKAEGSSGGELYFILGIDAFLEINLWKDFNSLFEEAAFIVMSRPPVESSSDSFEKSVESFSLRHISAAYTLVDHRHTLVHPYYQTIHLARVIPADIASSTIRRMIRQDKDPTNWLNPAVAGYIHKKGLYR